MSFQKLHRCLLTTLAVTAGALAVPASSLADGPRVALIPDANGAVYDGQHGLPRFPSTAVEPGVFDLTTYTYGDLGFDQVTTASLASYDTVVLWGARWDDARLSADARLALNTFAETHKVVIWDADSTSGGTVFPTPPSFADFIHPFAEIASGEHRAYGGEAAVVTDAAGNDLASGDPLDPRYIDTTALAAQKSAVGDSSVISSFGDAEWQTSLRGTNERINAQLPAAASGLPLVAWHYGRTGDHTGMVVYSGLGGDAVNSRFIPPDGNAAVCAFDASDQTLHPGCVNWVIKELSLQLAAPVRSTPDDCAPTCSAPSPGTGGVLPPTSTPTTGGTTTTPPPAPTTAPPTAPVTTTPGVQTGGQAATRAATCVLTGGAPKGWVRATLALKLHTSASDATRVSLATAKGNAVGSAAAPKSGVFSLKVDTRKLPSGKASALVATVRSIVGLRCALHFTLKVDNTAPRALRLRVTTAHGKRQVRFHASEAVTAKLVVHGKVVRTLHLGARAIGAFAAPKAKVTLVLTDRAKNVVRRVLDLR